MAFGNEEKKIKTGRKSEVHLNHFLFVCLENGVKLFLCRKICFLLKHRRKKKQAQFSQTMKGKTCEMIVSLYGCQLSTKTCFQNKTKNTFWSTGKFKLN